MESNFVSQKLKNDGPLASKYIFIAHAVHFYLINGRNFKSGHFFHIHSHKNLDFSVFLEKSDVAK